MLFIIVNDWIHIKDDEETKKDRERVDSSSATKEDKVNSKLNTPQDDGLSSSSGLSLSQSQSTTQSITQITDEEREREKQRQIEQVLREI